MSDTAFSAVRAVAGVTYEIDTDKARLDHHLIHRFLAESHWAKGIPAPLLARAIDHSMAFGLYRGEEQIGFARVVTDHATFAYLADVFILADERGKGLGRWLVETILAHPDLQSLRRWLLGTRDAQRLYRGCGFREPPPPFTFLERHAPDLYQGTRRARPRQGRLAPPGAPY
jgi:ribosomal protein S18 acetylase RimI-like enzyme